MMLAYLSALMVVSNPNGTVREYRPFRTMERCEHARAELVRNLPRDVVVICVRKD